MSNDEQVWKALSSPHRRAMLDALRDGPLTTTALCERLPELSRFAVMQHLGVLERAGVVLVRREGASAGTSSTRFRSSASWSAG